MRKGIRQMKQGIVALDARLRGHDNGCSGFCLQRVWICLASVNQWKKDIGFIYWPANVTERFTSGLQTILHDGYGNMRTGLRVGSHKITRFTTSFIMKNIPILFLQSHERSRLRSGTVHGSFALSKKTTHSGWIWERNLTHNRVMPAQAGIQSHIKSALVSGMTFYINKLRFEVKAGAYAL